MVWRGAALAAGAQIADFTYDSAGNLAAVATTSAGAPGFARQPGDQVVSRDGAVYFSAAAAGTGPFAWQWLSNGVPIPGATGDFLAVSNVAVPANLVSNGGFEAPRVATATFQTFAAGTNPNGWVVESGSVDVVRSVWSPFEQAQSLDLNGVGPGAIYQDLATTPGRNYYLDFVCAGLPAGSVLKTNTIWWEGAALATNVFDATGRSAAQPGWTHYEYLVTASGVTARLRFASLTAGTYGLALDAVRVVPVWPAPAGYSVILSNAAGSVTSRVASVQFDTDGNGLPDVWEREHFGGAGQDPLADSDGDGVANLEEWREGTDPNDPASFRPRLRLAATSGGAVTALPFQSSYTPGQTVAITAWADPGSLFARWSDGLAGAPAATSLALTSNLVSTALFGVAMASGGNYDGALAPGGTNLLALAAANGDRLWLRLGAFGFNGRLNLFDPRGILVGTAGNNTDLSLAVTATNTGVYLAEVTGYSPSGAGDYRLHCARLPGPLTVPAGDEGGGLTNGAVAEGVIDLGDLDLWSFAAEAGDSLMLRLASVGFNGQLNLYGPDGALVQSAGNSAALALAYTATNSGVFTAVVAASAARGQGTYRLRLAKFPGAFVISGEGGALTNGASVSASLEPGGLDLWTLAANRGGSLILRATLLTGSNSFQPLIQLYDPAGALLQSQASAATAEISLTVTNTGEFTVLITSATAAGAGTYRLALAEAPGAFEVPPGDEGGVLANGAPAAGVITAGDLDLWSFTAAAGDSLVLRVGEVTDDNGRFDPWMRLYGPDGALLASQYDYAAAEIAVSATNSGRFTVVVGDAGKASPYTLSDTGAYRLRLARVPGAFAVPAGVAGGPLTNGLPGAGVIGVGDLNQWTFNARAGDNMVLRVAELTDDNGRFDPWIRLYGPDGALLGSQFNYTAAEIAVTATNTGAFTVVVADAGKASPYYLSDTGAYQLSLALAPEPFLTPPQGPGGPLANGGAATGNLGAGGLNQWSFDANAGDNVILRVAELTDDNGRFDPWLRLYGPDGALLGSQFNYTAAEIAVTATNTGAFTVVVSDAGLASPYYLSDTGSYQLFLARAPGAFIVSDDGATLTPPGVYPGTISAGDLDLWGFRATAGDPLEVLATQTTDDNGRFDPWIRLYGPGGVLLKSAVGAASARISVTASNTGLYLVVVGDGALSSPYYLSDTGGYTLALSGMSGLTVFSGARRDGAGLVLSGAGGAANGEYLVLSATNPARPLAEWLPLATNHFDAAGAFQITNAILPGPGRFFRLQTR